MLGSGRDKHGLKWFLTGLSLKGVFKDQGCWGLPQRFQAMVGCSRNPRSRGLQGSAHSEVAQRLREILVTRDEQVDSS